MLRFKSRSICLSLLIVSLSFGNVVPAHADPMLTLNPVGGAVSGAPGDTVSWGFSITNDTTYYLLFDASYFCETGQDPQFTTCTQALGSYNDAIANDFTIIAPDSTVSQPFDASAMTGFGSYTISPTAALGSIDSGSLVATYMEFDGDPLGNGAQISGDIEISATASVTTAVATTPEPSSWMMLLTALAALGLIRTRVRQMRSQRVR